jgi:hypothetical protein
MEETTINAAPTADEIAVAPAAEPNFADQIVAENAAEKLGDGEEIEDAAELSSREFGERFVKTFTDEQLLVTSLAVSFARTIKAVAYNQKAGDPEDFIDLVADMAFEHSAEELKEAVEVCLAEMKARQGANNKVEG